MTDTETGAAPAAPEVTTAPVEQESTVQAPAAEPIAEPAETTTEEAATPETNTDSEEDQPKKKGGGFQNRIDKLTREKYEAELKAEKFQRELEQERSKAKPVDPLEEPKLDSGKFANVEDWQKAHKDWAEKLGEQKGYQKAREETLQQQRQREDAAIQAAVATRAAAARLKYSDFDVSVGPLIPVLEQNDAVRQYLIQEPMGAEMAYHLTKNPVVLDEIRKMPPYQAGRELLKLEARLSAAPPPKTVTKAPDPIKTVGTNEKVSKSPNDMSMDEFVSKYGEAARKRKG